MKIGRNDKCPCGSGKKYKNCCLNKDKKINDEEIQLLDIGTILHLMIGSNNLIKHSTSFIQIYDKYCNDYNFDKYSSIIDEKNIKELLKFTEELIIKKCSKFPSYELFYWFRRIKPTNIVPWFRDSTAYSYHELMKLCIFQFGNKIDNTVYDNSDNQLKGIHPKNIDKYFKDFSLLSSDKTYPKEVVEIINAIYDLEIICAFYIHVRNHYRIFLKGGIYQYNEESGFSIKPKNDEISFLINLYDTRAQKRTLLTPIGATSEDYSHTKTKFNLTGLQYNFKNIELDTKYVKLINHGSYNFIPGIISLDDYYKYTKNFNEIFEAKYDFSIEVLLSIIMSFSNSLLTYLTALYKEHTIQEQQYINNLLQRGYTIIKRNDDEDRKLINDFIDTYALLFPDIKTPDYKPFLKAFNYLFFQMNNYDNIEKQISKEFLFMQITKEISIVDYTSFHHILVNFLSPLNSLDGKKGNIASNFLEKETNDKLIELVGKEHIYIWGKVRNDKKDEKEIDASFYIDEYLFIIECKSLSVSDGSIYGDINCIKFRTKKIKEFIKEVENKVDFLIKNTTNLNHPLPENIKYIVPIVITSFSEYIWEKNESLFISETLPRILTVNELEDLVNNTELKQLKNKPYTRKLQDFINN